MDADQVVVRWDEEEKAVRSPSVSSKGGHA